MVYGDILQPTGDADADAVIPGLQNFYDTRRGPGSKHARQTTKLKISSFCFTIYTCRVDDTTARARSEQGANTARPPINYHCNDY